MLSIATTLGLLDVTHGYAIEAPPCIWPRGASNAARPLFATAFLKATRSTEKE